MRKLTFALTILLSMFIFTQTAAAKIGVGVGTGKITVDEDLKPGQIYQIPSITVVNTGDEPLYYSLNTQYHHSQPELKPPANWFSFSPDEFYLEPGKTQVVEIRLDIPLKTEPGDYFAYLEAFPLKKSETQTTTIGVAAASKLYFTISPANIFQAIYYKIISLWRIYYPWSLWIVVTITLIVLVLISRKYININIGLKGKSKTEPKQSITKVVPVENNRKSMPKKTINVSFRKNG